MKIIFVNIRNPDSLSYWFDILDNFLQAEEREKEFREEYQ